MDNPLDMPTDSMPPLGSIVMSYPSNVNLHKPPWLQWLIFGMSVLTLSIIAFTVVFQLKHPKSM